MVLLQRDNDQSRSHAAESGLNMEENKESKKTVVTSEIAVTLKVIGGKWKPLILDYLQYHGAKRYSEIYRYVKDAPKKTLTAQLRELEADGILSRTVIPTTPPQVEYSFTEHGKSLFPVLDAMCRWGYENAGELYEVRHPSCTEDDIDRIRKEMEEEPTNE